jgi:hypothetical protein
LFNFFRDLFPDYYFFNLDCQTHFTFFSSISTPSPSPEKTTAEIRTSIYDFQRQIDREDSIDEPDFANEYRAEMRKKFPPKDEKQKALKKKLQKKPPRNLFEAIFSVPKPARPQLHAYF